MLPRYWLPRRSWWLEHNQCHSLYLFPAFSSSLTLAKAFPQKMFSLRDVLLRRSPALLAGHFVQYRDMAVTIELQNTGDSRARREILAGVEHALSDVAGQWRVSIVGSRANDNWEMKVEPGDSSVRTLWLARLANTNLRQYGTCLLSCCRRASDDLPYWFALPSNRRRHR